VCAVTPVTLTAASELSCRRSAQAAAAPKIARLVEQARALASAGRPARIGAAIVVSAQR
jgi:hypothetical protein